MTENPLARPGRRAFARWALALGAAALAGCAGLPDAGPPPPPIVFVHGNGDSAALWMTTLWRFESNGWPRERLHAIDLPYPLARDADDQAQPGRTSTAEHRQFLAAEIDKVLARTGAAQVVLFGNSRGGNAIRSVIANGGAAKVSHAILGGTPNHGVWSDPAFRPTNEFNGAGPFLQALNNQGAPGVEVTPGPRWMTIRSDRNDKFAQPDGLWIGAAGRPTNVGFDSPELKGAQNVVIPGIDHRETSFSPQAFAAAYRFITGRDPAVTTPPVQPQVVLNGTVSGLGLGNDPARGAFVTNLPLAGATVEVYATDPATGERRGAPLLRRTTGPDGRWGPVSTDPRTPLEFVLSAPGYATSHIYRAPFARSSDVVHLRAERMADADRAAGAVVTLSRPRGYFGVPRDRFSLDGQSPAPGIAPGVAGLASSRLRLPAGPVRPVAGEFNGERIVGRTWPAAEGRLVTLEIH
jgi:pimeloyl-ACP methyl ester carboxylesterase